MVGRLASIRPPSAEQAGGAWPRFRTLLDVVRVYDLARDRRAFGERKGRVAKGHGGKNSAEVCGGSRCSGSSSTPSRATSAMRASLM